MSASYLHEQPDFADLLRILEAEGVDGGYPVIPYLIEKDYWIMHVLYGLKEQGFVFELKGGTSLSKGYHLIDRFSEDIDIHIHPPAGSSLEKDAHKTKASHAQARKEFYDQLAKKIQIPGIVSVTRDADFDDTDHYRSGGIRLHYSSVTEAVKGIKTGILLEVGFDTVAPNESLTISSWAFDGAQSKGVEVKDNRAIGIPCYHPGYTFVEKLQTIATKYRKERETGEDVPNFMRQYYDLSQLLLDSRVQTFIPTPEYQLHKEKRFPKKDLAIPIHQNQAFLLEDPVIFERYKQRYEATRSLYYKGQPDFTQLIDTIRSNVHLL